MHQIYAFARIEYMGMHIQNIEPRDSLVQDILTRIHTVRTRVRAQKHLALFTCVFCVSICVSIFTMKFLFQEISSGLIVFSSLVFSDTALIMSNWREFSYSLLESLPITLLILTIVMCMSTLCALQAIQKNYAIAKKYF